jgi:hypothetical protein
MVHTGNLANNSVGGEEIQRGLGASYAWRSMARKEAVARGDPEKHMTTHHPGNITRDATVNNVTEQRKLGNHANKITCK